MFVGFFYKRIIVLAGRNVISFFFDTLFGLCMINDYLFGHSEIVGDSYVERERDM